MRPFKRKMRKPASGIAATAKKLLFCADAS